MVYELSVGTHYLQQASKKGIDNRQVISRVFADVKELKLIIYSNHCFITNHINS